jgi:hypothetical protein
MEDGAFRMPEPSDTDKIVAAILAAAYGLGKSEIPEFINHYDEFCTKLKELKDSKKPAPMKIGEEVLAKARQPRNRG